MTSIILECSKNKGSGNNTNWVNTFQNPITLNEGDILGTKLVFVDSKNIQQDLHIPRDITATLKFGYYVSNWNTANPTLNNNMYYNPYNNHQPHDTSVNPSVPDPHTTNLGSYGDYIAWKWKKNDGNAFIYGNGVDDDCEPLLESVDIKIPHGQYAGAELAKLITDELSRLDLKTANSSRFFLDKNGFLKSSGIQSYETRDYPYHFWRVNGELDAVPNHITDYGFCYSDWGLLNPSNSDLYGTDTEYFFGASQVSVVFDGKFKFQYLHSPIYNNAGGGAPTLSNALLNLQNTGNFLYMKAKIVNHTETQLDTTPTQGEKELLTNGTNILLVLSDGNSVAVQLNANITAGGLLSYPDASADPNYPLDGTAIEVRVEENTVNPLNHWRNAMRNGGVYLSELTSVFDDDGSNAGFWELLGFTPSEMVVPFSATKMPKQSELDRATTSGFMGLSALTSKNGNLKISDNQNGNNIIYLTADENTTEGIVGSDYNLNDAVNMPFYTIECIGKFQTNLQDDKDIKHSITSIVSKQWSNANFITGYGGESGLTYEHKGEPITISSINTRILENGVEPQNIGSNCSVFLEIFKKMTNS